MIDETKQPNYPTDRKNPKMGEVVKQGYVIGRNKIVVPPDEVELMASLGCPDTEIAHYFGIDQQSLRYNFRDQLIQGRQGLKTSLRRAQIRTALEGNVTMLIWLGKQILGQKENIYDSEEDAPLPWTNSEYIAAGKETAQIEDQTTISNEEQQNANS